MVVGAVGWVEHVCMVRGRDRSRVLGGMTEGEHVEGGGGRAMQHLEAWEITSYLVAGTVHHTY